MKDLETAKSMLNQRAACIAVVKDGCVLYQSSGRGIFPLYDAVILRNIDFTQSAAADKIVGKAAAMLFIHSGVTELYAEVLSEEAEAMLKQSSVHFTYGKKVPQILNRNKDGLCPVETLAERKTPQDYPQLVEDIASFLKRIGML